MNLEKEPVMGKVDDLRALREARYNEARARLGTPTKSVPLKVTRTAPQATQRPAGGIAPGDTVEFEYPRVVLPEKPLPEKLPEEAGELCGHRAISGKTCIRPPCHSEKNHRYGKAEKS